MSGEKIPHDTWQEKLIAEARLRESEREKGYRARALKIHPPICARCGREFEGKKPRDFTVHHRDHDHENNPPDGSNWELLCLYCHDNEHRRRLESAKVGNDFGGPDHGVATYAAICRAQGTVGQEEFNKVAPYGHERSSMALPPCPSNLNPRLSQRAA